MSLKRSLYEGYKNVHTRLCGAKTVSDFDQTGTLTPREFVEAGDELVLKVPVWQWVCGATHRQQHLPADKQCLVYRGAACAARTNEKVTSVAAGDTAAVAAATAAVSQASLRVDEEDADGFVTIADTTTTSSTQRVQRIDDVDDDDDDDDAAEQGRPVVLSWDADASDAHSSDSEDAGAERIDRGGGDDDDDDDTDDEEIAPRRGRGAHDGDDAAQRARQARMRYYDVYITYDAYYRTPRLYLVGYASDRITPLTVDAMKQDVYHSNYDRTVTMDAHPVLGVTCISIHPCRHAETMRHLMARMKARRGADDAVTPGASVSGDAATRRRQTAPSTTAPTYSHRMALFLFLKFISTVVPYIAYDVSAAVDV